MKKTFPTPLFLLPFLFSTSLVFAADGPATPPASRAGADAAPVGADLRAARRLVWRDEFDGDALDKTKWQVWGTMSSTDNVYTNDERTVQVGGGLLRLRVLPTDVPGKVATLPRGLVTRDRMAFRRATNRGSNFQ